MMRTNFFFGLRLAMMALLQACALAAQVTATLKIEPTPAVIRAGDTFTGIVTVEIAPDWHISSLTQPVGGPMPTSIQPAAGQPFKLAAAPTGPKPRAEYSNSFEMTVETHEESVAFKVPLVATAEIAVGTELAVELTYQACTKVSCLLPKTERLTASLVPAVTAAPSGQTESTHALKFTALDGREIDTASMRGRVILIDFWATWCAPCVAELPHVKQVYARYREYGFEVIGVSLDRQQDRQKLVDFCARMDLRWPQHFDGLGGQSKVVARFGVTSIPATFLLGKGGELRATNLRGEHLEKAVRQALGL